MNKFFEFKNINFKNNRIITNNFKNNNINNFKNNIINTNNKPLKNDHFSLIGLCVSYNYFDTLQFMLPVNYLHFEKIYLITQQNDLETIEFCKKFENVIVLFHNFKNNNKRFDKYGALNYAQEIIYKEHPDSWYLIIDSDIILPNNIIDILEKENLNNECIYGAFRINVNNTRELMHKFINDENINILQNNILYIKDKPPSILGCFQLYKKKVFHRNNFDNASEGDHYFGYDNFNLFCNMENLIYFHLGEGSVNWYGKVVTFIDNINIDINDIYYNCNKNTKNVYYNKKCKKIYFNMLIDSNDLIDSNKDKSILKTNRNFKKMLFNI